MTEPKHLNAGSSGEWGWHATELALRCPQLFAYHHRIKNAPLDGNRAALIRGSLVHQGLAHHYERMRAEQTGTDPGEWATPEAAIVECAEELAEESGTREPQKFVATATNIVNDYIAHWGGEKLEVLHVEEVFTADIVGFAFTQRFDLVARRNDGKVYIFDHKTTGRIDSKVPERYTLSGQFLGMANFGKQVFGTGFGGVIINLIGCGPAGSFTPSGTCNFERVTAAPAPNAQRLFPLSVQHARQRIAALDKSGLDPWEWPKTLSEQTCITAYGKCDGYELCRWGKP